LRSPVGRKAGRNCRFCQVPPRRQEDEAWEIRLASTQPLPRLESFLRESAAEGDEPLDPIACEFARAAEFLACLCPAQRTYPACARRAYSLFLQNPAHPSLRFKKTGRLRPRLVRADHEQYRAVGERRGDTISWVWIGTHNEFDNLFG